MLVLPISMVGALALGYLLVHSLLSRERHWLFSALLAACALQTVMVSLVQYYGVEQLHLLQPVTATVIPVLAWVTFQTTALRPFDAGRDLPYLALPALAAFSVVFAQEAVDFVVIGTFLAYGAAILFKLRQGADGLALIRLEAGDWPCLIWRTIAVVLILSAVSDAAISVLHGLGLGWLQPWVISLSSSLSLALIGALCLSRSLIGGEEAEDRPARDPDPSDAEQDAETMERLKALIGEEGLYLDPDLTLARLSRRLRLPAKRVSAAINRVTGENVSRYVNEFRIRRACERLKAGDSVTAAMLNSGFNTKSNFNREFLRILGTSPSAWLAKERLRAPVPIPRERKAR